MIISKTFKSIILIATILCSPVCYGTVTDPNAKLELIGSGYQFTEGPATDDWGNIYFSDVDASIIYMWRPDGSISTHLTNTGGSNGLFINRVGNLIICEGDNGRIVFRDPSGRITVLADQYNGLPFNQPNDLWVTPSDGIYFSDPAYDVPLSQDGEHVYYISPDHTSVIRVIDDMVRPNGIIGKLDGSQLYVTDHGANQTFVFDINADGTLTNKKLFIPVGGDGMTTDKEGNIYLAVTDGIAVYDAVGNEIEMIFAPDEPTNVTFGGADHKTLFITARSNLYTIRMLVEGVRGQGSNPGGDVSIEQAISDEAQLKTMSFSGLAFMTGNMCEDTFFPPGKVSDFFGFQYFRDIAPNGFGHNTEYAGRVADNVLGLLTNDQVQALVSLANDQYLTVDDYGYKRFVLIKAFRRLFEGDLPEGATCLDMGAVMDFSADLYEIDAEISFDRACVLGDITTTMTNKQKEDLVQLKDDLDELFEQTEPGSEIDPEDWPVPASSPDLSGLIDPDACILVFTYATQLYSWYLGSVYGDTYFCPERHGTYFGSFYMKDIPPLTASEPVSIDPNLTAEMGQAFLDTLDNDQQALVTILLELQRNALKNIVSTRQEISETLRPLMDGEYVDKNAVITLIREYGQYDGQIVYNYATNYVDVYNSLTTNQYDTLMDIRIGYYQLFPEYLADPTVYNCTTPWLFSDPLPEWPIIENTDFLFGITSLLTDTDTLSVGTGGTVDFYLSAGEDNAGRKYLILGSMSGSVPGFPLPNGGKTMPINRDGFTNFVLSKLNTTLFMNFLAVLDGEGLGTAQINAPPVSASWIGKIMTYAYCLEGQPDWDFVSNPVEIEFVP